MLNKLFNSLLKSNDSLNHKTKFNDIPSKTVNEMVQEIHDTFYTEVDRLLEEAKVIKSNETTKTALIYKRDKLVKLGFINTKEVKEANLELSRLAEIERFNDNNKILTEAINYFSSNYPQYKFITEESVDKICNKYNLVHAPVASYIGTVPDENLKHMENFKISKEDKAYIESSYSFGRFSREWTKHIDYQYYIENKNNSSKDTYSMTIYNYSEAPLVIVAPLKDFDQTNMELIENQLVQKIEIPDPVVL